MSDEGLVEEFVHSAEGVEANEVLKEDGSLGNPPDAF